MGKPEKATQRFCDYYSFMSYSDFAAWVDADDDSDPVVMY
jgi:hypothetical protein